jgi:hypothetical protein
MKLINILEHYDNETDCFLLLNYDKTPKILRKHIDSALLDPDKSITIPYKEGLQELPDNHNCVISKASDFISKVVEFHAIEFYTG